MIIVSWGRDRAGHARVCCHHRCRRGWISAKNLEKNRLFVEYFQFKRTLNFQILNFYVILNSNFLLKKIILWSIIFRFCSEEYSALSSDPIKTPRTPESSETNISLTWWDTLLFSSSSFSPARSSWVRRAYTRAKGCGAHTSEVSWFHYAPQTRAYTGTCPPRVERCARRDQVRWVWVQKCQAQPVFWGVEDF